MSLATSDGRFALMIARSRREALEVGLMSAVFRPYFMKTARVGFSLWEKSDTELAKLLWGNPQVTRLIGGPFTEEMILDRLDREILTQKLHAYQYWPLFLLDGDVFVGACGLRPFKSSQTTVELGFHLLPEYWGKGLASEASRRAISHAFNELGKNALFAGHHPENTVSEKLLLKLGFENRGKQYYAPTGLEHPSYLLSKQEKS